MTIQQLSLLTLEVSGEQKHFNSCLHHALHSFCDASKRWAQHQKTGLTDQALKTAIAFEFGEFGGFHSTEFNITYKGGEQPKLWIDVGFSEKPTLQGRALIKAVRTYMRIPYPD